MDKQAVRDKAKTLRREQPIANIKLFIMITLEKLLTELKAESFNEIVAGHGKGHKGGRKGSGGGSSDDSTGSHHATMTTRSTNSDSSDS